MRLLDISPTNFTSIRRPPATVEDVRQAARRRLPRLAFDFIDGGADAELSLRRNAEAFELRTLRPRQLAPLMECERLLHLRRHRSRGGSLRIQRRKP